MKLFFNIKIGANMKFKPHFIHAFLKKIGLIYLYLSPNFNQIGDMVPIIHDFTDNFFNDFLFLLNSLLFASN
jgi:hypothetical protein